MQHEPNEVLIPKAVKAIKKHCLYFMGDIPPYLGMAHSTFYARGLDKTEDIRMALLENRTNTKVKMRKKWEMGDNATTQIALMKLIASEDERKRMSQTYVDMTTDGDKIVESIDYSKLSKQTLREILNAKTIQDDGNNSTN